MAARIKNEKMILQTLQQFLSNNSSLILISARDYGLVQRKGTVSFCLATSPDMVDDLVENGTYETSHVHPLKKISNLLP